MEKHEKDLYPSVEEQEGGTSDSLKPRTAGIWGNLALLLLHNTHSCFFRGHRDPADDIHYIKWHGSLLCHQRKKMYHCLLFDVSPKRFQWDGEEKMEKSKVWRRQMRGRRRWCCFYFSFHVLTVCLRASWRLRKSHFKAFCFEIELLYSLFAFY